MRDGTGRKRQRAAAVQNLAEIPSGPANAKRLGLRQPSGALERGNVNSGCRRGKTGRAAIRWTCRSAGVLTRSSFGRPDRAGFFGCELNGSRPAAGGARVVPTRSVWPVVDVENCRAARMCGRAAAWDKPQLRPKRRIKRYTGNCGLSNGNEGAFMPAFFR